MVNFTGELMNIISKHKRYLAYLPVTLTLVISGQAYAAIDELLVVAQKREQNIQEVGIAVTAFGTDSIQDFGWASTENIAAQTPGLVATSFSGDSSVSIFSVRGVAQNDFADHQEAPTALYVDGAYIAATGAAGMQLYDVERVEVLRGPQGTLFGRNATGGLVHIITKDPEDELGGSVGVKLGEFGQRTIDGAISIPISDKLSARFAMISDQNDGYFNNLNGDDARAVDHVSWRGKLKFTPTDATEFMFTAWQNEVDDTGAYDFRPGFVEFGDTPTDFQGVGDVTPKPNEGAINPSGFTKKDSTGYSLEINHDFGGVTLTSITDFQELEKNYREDSDGNITRSLEYTADQDSQQFSQELRLAGETERTNWVAGIYYLDIDGDFDSFLNAPTFGGSPRNMYSLTTESWSVFGQVEYQITDRLTAIGGIRYVKDDKDFDFSSTCELVTTLAPGAAFAPGFPENDCALFTSGDPLNPLVVEIPGTLSFTRSDEEFSGKAQLDFQINDDFLVYAGYNRGVKGGGFTAPLDGFLTPDELPFDPEILNSYEVGFKSTILDGTTRFNASAFYYDYQDYQGFIFQGLTSVVRNNDAVITGAEIEIFSEPVEGLELGLGIALLDATVENVEVSPGVFRDQTMITAPEVSVNWLARKSWDMQGGSGVLAAQVDGFYVGDQEYNTTNSTLASGDSYSVWNARLEYTKEAGEGSWSVGVFVNNLADEEYKTYSFDLGASFGYGLEVFGPPRWAGVDLRYNW